MAAAGKGVSRLSLTNCTYISLYTLFHKGTLWNGMAVLHVYGAWLSYMYMAQTPYVL